VENPLHRARLERHLDLAALNARTMLGMGVLLKIDQGRFSELPAGIYARAYVRAFASAVGLDPAAVIAELTPLLPEAPDPFPVIREIEQAADQRRRSKSTQSRCAAAVVDAAMLVGVALAVLRLIALVCGVTTGYLVQHEAPAVAVVCAVPSALYFLLFRGIGGRTLGGAVCRLPQLPAPAPLGLNDILLRALR
jgi:hypothetical protein